jgi:hypothetical protein
VAAEKVGPMEGLLMMSAKERERVKILSQSKGSELQQKEAVRFANLSIDVCAIVQTLLSIRRLRFGASRMWAPIEVEPVQWSFKATVLQRHQV